MKKKMYVLGVAALVAAMLALSGVAQSAMWVGAELGGNFPLNTDINANLGPVDATLSGVGIQPGVIGGAIIGYDFVNTGFGAYAWPDWMKYFSFAMDITYNKLNIRGGQTVDATFQNLSGTIDLADLGLSRNMSLKGYEVAWTFLFMAHYGFLKDSEVPSGRINPYIGVGPALLWSGFENPWGNGGASAMNVALVVEPGIRWVCLPNVSIDTAMRYRYAVPSYDIATIPGVGNFSLSPTLHQLSFLVRANYHF
ncbi:MAG: hypothetical protein Q7O12_01835 [Deltaproteobacteria bacterium]|nr:hypothetical protein [Deltaproteobacteria bacterium]